MTKVESKKGVEQKNDLSVKKRNNPKKSATFKLPNGQKNAPKKPHLKAAGRMSAHTKRTHNNASRKPPLKAGGKELSVKKKWNPKSAPKKLHIKTAGKEMSVNKNWNPKPKPKNSQVKTAGKQMSVKKKWNPKSAPKMSKKKANEKISVEVEPTQTNDTVTSGSEQMEEKRIREKKVQKPLSALEKKERNRKMKKKRNEKKCRVLTKKHDEAVEQLRLYNESCAYDQLPDPATLVHTDTVS